MLMDIIKSYYSQWQDVRLGLPMYTLRQLNVNTSTLPRLERLFLDAPFVYRDDIPAPIIIPNAPLLREVKTIDFPYLQVDPRNPFERLTTLDFKGMGMSTIIAFLRCCPNLPDLSTRRTGDSEPPHLELRSLRSLKIHFGSILPLTLPRWNDLKYYPEWMISMLRPTPSDHWCHAPATSTNTIHHLKLDFTSFTKIEPEIAIQALHGVGVLPRLKRLEINDSRYISEIEYCRPLMDILLWRREHAALESFELFPGAHIFLATMMVNFRVLGETGLQLRVTTRNWNHLTSFDVF
ncbi:hypothetical protein B0H13DRAFT_2652326 [Mycena leptocephala]|nr:hypothetical protein B0H13DRAFT_2652326 [Mycena leptocephala]